VDAKSYPWIDDIQPNRGLVQDAKLMLAAVRHDLRFERTIELGWFRAAFSFEEDNADSLPPERTYMSDAPIGSFLVKRDEEGKLARTPVIFVRTDMLREYVLKVIAYQAAEAAAYTQNAAQNYMHRWRELWASAVRLDAADVWGR
jgi:hypothetical protein